MLRFGIMCNGLELAAWEADCVKKLLALEKVEPVLLIVDRDHTSSASAWHRIKRVGWYGWYLFNLLFVKRQTKAMQLRDISYLVAGVPQLECVAIRKGKFSQYFHDANVETIKQYNLDFILRFGFGIIRGNILNVARFGVWSFHHGDEDKYRGGPPGFWEMYDNDPVTGAILQRLTDRLDGGVILKKGFLKTNPISYVKNRDAIHFASASWPVQVCRDIENRNTDYLEDAPSKSTAPVCKVPTNLQMIIFIGKIVCRWVKQWFLSGFFYYQWNIGIVDLPIHLFLSNVNYKIRWCSPPPSHSFRADPFAVAHGDVVDVLFEDYQYSKGRGFISAARMKDGRIIDERVVIDPGVHVSYPYLVAHEGSMYCIPEMSAEKEIGLYRAKGFPFSWEKITTIVHDFAGVDSTVFCYQGRWWLMTMNADGDAISELYIWHAPNLTGPWEPHLLNPVKADVRSSRPAGTPFTHEGYLYRPVQDCSYSYGQRVVLNRISEITPTRFNEEAVGTVDPDPYGPYPNGLHTLSSAGRWTLVDGVRRRFAGRSMSVVWYKLRRITHLVHSL